MYVCVNTSQRKEEGERNINGERGSLISCPQRFPLGRNLNLDISCYQKGPVCFEVLKSCPINPLSLARDSSPSACYNVGSSTNPVAESQRRAPHKPKSTPIC